MIDRATDKVLLMRRMQHILSPFKANCRAWIKTLSVGILSIAKNLVEMHGCTVRANSRGEGQGATFAIQLPLRLG